MKTSKKGNKAPETLAAADEDSLETTLPTAARSKAGKRALKTDAIKKPGPKKTNVKTNEKASADEINTPAKKRRKTTATSPVKKAKTADPAADARPALSSEANRVLTPVEIADPLASMSPIDRLLAEPTLPVLERENRARLQMQSPTKLHFYWSVRENPWATLRKAFGGDTGSYTLALKLVEMRSGTEQIHNADADGSWWFDVRPDSEYQAEIGFYAPNRPYIRIVHSNVIQTPRLKPSSRRAAESDWTVSAQEFAKVLDVAGFARDAVDVAIAGDDPDASATAARRALRQFANGNEDTLAVIDDEDIRLAMLAFADGQKLDELRWKVSAELFAYLQASGNKLSAERAEDALREHFDLDDVEIETEETRSAVFGASMINFPRIRRSRRKPRMGSEPSPISSHSFGRTIRP